MIYLGMFAIFLSGYVIGATMARCYLKAVKRQSGCCPQRRHLG